GNILLNYEYFRQDSINSSERDFSSGSPNKIDLVGPEKKNSVYAFARQQIFNGINAFADLSHTENRVDFANDDPNLGPFAYSAFSRQYGAVLGVDAPLRGSWTSELAASWSRNDLVSEGAYLDPDLADFSDAHKSAYALKSFSLSANGKLFQLPGGMTSLATGLE